MEKIQIRGLLLLLPVLFISCALHPGKLSIFDLIDQPGITPGEPINTPESTPAVSLTPTPSVVSDTPSPVPDTPDPTQENTPTSTPTSTLVPETPSPIPTSTPGENSIIINHLCTDISEIPQVWIDEVKKMLLSVPGESHGRGYMYGLELVEAGDTQFAGSVKWYGEPGPPTSMNLRATPVYRNTIDGWSSMGGEENFWTNDSARTMMKNFLGYMDDNENPVSAFGFAWCWDMTNNGTGGGVDTEYGVRWAGSSEGGLDGNLRWGIDDEDNTLTGNSVNLYTYINTVVDYNAWEPAAISFLTTGPVDGNHGTEAGYQRYLKHEALREFVMENGGVLFDYADILCWDNGVQYIDSWDGHTFQNGDPGLATGGTGYDGGQGGCHISEDGCRLIGNALWWMLARIAGWPG
jgi:hypothetical protein